MKRLFAFLLIIAVTQLTASEYQRWFEEGNNYYQNGKYEQAIKAYTKILEAGYESGELYFNMGNAYYRLNELGLSRLNYERAARFLKNDEALQQNLTLLKQRLIDQIDQPPRFILTVWWEKLMNLFNIGVLTYVVAGLLWITLLVAGIHLYFRRRGRMTRFRALLMIMSGLFILFVFVLGQKIYRLETEEFAIILQTSVTLRAEPRSSGTEVFVLHEGTRVKVLRGNQDWLEIRLTDGKTGWLKNSNLEII